MNARTEIDKRNETNKTTKNDPYANFFFYKINSNEKQTVKKQKGKEFYRFRGGVSLLCLLLNNLVIWFVAEKKINILEKQRYKEFHIIGFGCLLSALWPTIFLVVLLLFLCFTWPFCCCCCWLVCVYRIYVAFHIRWNNNKNVTTSSRLKKRSNEEKKHLW